MVMATNAAFPPYEYKDGDKIVGIDAEIAQAVADKLGMKPEIVDVDFGAVLTGVEQGKYDFGMAGITVTDERKEKMDFSDTYATGIQVIIVKDGSSITCLDDLFVFDEEGNPIYFKETTIGDMDEERCHFTALTERMTLGEMIGEVEKENEQLKQENKTLADALTVYFQSKIKGDV